MDLLKHFQELNVVPEGWICRAQLAEASGLSETAVRTRMRKLNLSGKFIRGRWWYPPEVSDTSRRTASPPDRRERGR